MATLASGGLSPIDAMTPERMAQDAGNSSHEVRTWVAAFAALGAAGPYEVAHSFSRPIPECIAGFGVMTAHTAHRTPHADRRAAPRGAAASPDCGPPA
jgi:2,3-dihydroxyphenylpropionate 1,2-dioxygenase